MKSCPLYTKDGNINSNSNNIGKYNPYGVIQNGGKRKSRRTKKTIVKKCNKKQRKSKKTRKYRR